jgi:hypothetical protein
MSHQQHADVPSAVLQACRCGVWHAAMLRVCRAFMTTLALRQRMSMAQ